MLLQNIDLLLSVLGKLYLEKHIIRAVGDQTRNVSKTDFLVSQLLFSRTNPHTEGHAPPAGGEQIPNAHKNKFPLWKACFHEKQSRNEGHLLREGRDKSQMCAIIVC